MDETQFILRYHGTVTINHEYTVNLARGDELLINWFPNNDLIVETKDRRAYFNIHNTQPLSANRYLIELETTENLYDLPVKFARGDYLVAGNIVIDHRNQAYFTADALDILPDEIVAAHGNKVTRVLFSGTKTATEHYVLKEKNPS